MKSNFYVVSDSTIQKESETEFCFKGHGRRFFRTSISLFEAITNLYTLNDIANLMNISCQEVCNQFNQMAKESGYKLFN